MPEMNLFNFKYNTLAAIQVIIGLCNSILLIKIFGVTDDADAYLLSSSVIISLQMVELMGVEQFLFYYNDIKVKSNDEAHYFFEATLFFSIILGFLFFIMSSYFSSMIVKLFAFNLDINRLLISSEILFLSSLALAFTPANHIIRGFLNAEGHFSVPFLLSAMPSLFSFLGLVYCWLSEQHNIRIVVFAFAVGHVLYFFINIIFLKRIRPIRFRCYHPSLIGLMKNSFSMKGAHNMHNFFSIQVINNFLSSFPLGHISIFYYAKKGIDTIFAVTAGPSQSIMIAMTSELWSTGNIQNIRTMIKKYLLKITPIYMSMSIISFLLIPLIFTSLIRGKISEQMVGQLQIQFILLSLWYLLILVESPFVTVGISSKKSYIFFIVNSFYLLIFFSLTKLLKVSLGIYSLAVSASLAQMINLFLYVAYAILILRQESVNK